MTPAPQLSSFILCLFTVLVQVFSQDSVQYTCPQGWTVKEVSCYLLLGTEKTEKETWYGAENICERMGASLVRIRDYYDNEQVGQFISTISPTTSSVWLGMNRLDVPAIDINVAKWGIDGPQNASVYEGRWADNSPDNNKGKTVYMTINNGQYKWQFGNYYKKMAFICERMSCPSGSFFCNNDKCINNQWKCDGVDDCGDNSDEVECPAKCRTLLTASTGTITSQNYPNAYSSSSVCLWTIIGKEGTNILVEFTSFNTEKNADIVEVFIGGKTEATATSIARLSGTISGTTRYRSYNNYLIVKFITDSQIAKQGFSLQYSSISDGVAESVSLIATNTKTPLNPPRFQAAVGLAYLGSQEYIWILTAEEARKIITIERISIDLFPGDEVEIFDGDSASAKELYSYSSLNNDNIPLDTTIHHSSTGARLVSSTGRQMTIVLTTDKTTSGSGFTFHYWQGCTTSLTSETGDIFSPGNWESINYANFQTCTWKIEIPSRKGFTLFFDSGSDMENNKDFLKIFTDKTNNTGTAIHSGNGFTGTGLTTSGIHSSNGQMYIEFKTDAVVNKIGFEGAYSVDCPDPQFDNTATTVNGPTNWRYRDTITVSCKLGYSFAADMYTTTSVSLTCQFGGAWDKTIPRCKPVYCGLPTAVTNGYYYNSTGVVFDKEVYFSCYPGFNMIGSPKVDCQNSKLWTNQPSCQGAVCPSAQSIMNSQRTIVAGDLSSYASIIKYECNPGFELVGEPILFCQSDNSWSSSFPTCRRLKCPLPEIMHATLSRNTFPDYQQSITVQCDTGFSINGSQTLTCNEYQTFGDLPHCQNINECDLGTSNCRYNCHDTIGSFTCSCNPGYYLMPDKQTCAEILECQDGTAGCDHSCEDFGGGYQCACKSGYELFTKDGTSNLTIPPSENGQLSGDIYHLNHTCVRKLCPDAPSIVNGYLMTKRENNHYGDTVEYFCKQGFILNGNRLLTCGNNGLWSPSSPPTCQAATCSQENYQSFGLTNGPSSVSPTGSVGYDNILTINCQVPGKTDFTKERKCVYNMTSDTYLLHGNSYECGVIDCGDPGRITGANFNTPTNTRFGDAFTFSCSNLYNVRGSSSDKAKPTNVKCEADGHWDLGSLQCVGATCTDPGYPAGGSITINGFEQNGYVTFNCDRNGFAPDRSTGIECRLNNAGNGLIWNNTVPNCVDVTKPILSNCPSDITVSAYSRPSFSPPTVSDNTNTVKSFTITPEYANSTMIIERTKQTVTYTAEDHAGNTASCSFDINVKDEEPPRITNCPRSRVEYVTAVGETKEITTVDPATISATDNVGVITPITVSPQKFIASANALGKQIVTVTAFDAAGNSDSCSFEILIQASQCSPLSVPQPLHGSRVCEEKTGGSGGYTCNVTCNAGYYFFDYPDQSVVSMDCIGPNGNWDKPIITACTLANVQAKFSQVFDIQYISTTTITDACKEAYRGDIAARIPSAQLRLYTTCQNIDSIYQVALSKDDSSFNINNNQMTVRFYVTIGPDGLEESRYTDCAEFTKTNFKIASFTLNDIKNVPNCPALTGSWTEPANFQQGTSCIENRKKADVNGGSYCLGCPEGTYTSGPSTCSLCGVGTYNSLIHQTQCTDCPVGLSTHKEGIVSAAFCQAKCPAGYRSTSGMSPCTQCDFNTYFKDSTTCDNCPVDTITHIRGAQSSAACRAKCPAGQYSYDGYAPNCLQCPQNYYQPTAGSKNCIQCPVDKYTTQSGSDEFADCIDASTQLCSVNTCSNGGTCEIRNHDFYCVCQSGYYGRTCQNVVNHCSSSPCYNDGICSNSAAGFTCNCETGTTGERCETDLDTECQLNTCANGGVCVNRVRTFQCVCPVTFTGATCTGQSNICQDDPCLNNAECISYDNVRRKCVCNPGFTGGNCGTNIQECNSNPCFNDGTCEDRVNGYFCRCKSGYSGSRCEVRASPCLGVNCGVGSTCVDDYTTDTYRCICNTNYTYGDVCQYMVNVDSTPSLTGITEETKNTIAECMAKCTEIRDNCVGFSYKAVDKKCYTFYSSQNIQTLNSDTSFIFFEKCCIRPTDDFYTPWYNIDKDPINGGDDERRSQLDSLGVKLCKGTEPVGAECRVFNKTLLTFPGETGDDITTSCSVQGLKCETANTNFCNDYEVRYRCSASQVFKGRTCTNVNYCNNYPNPCKNNGACVSTLDSYRCNCQPGYTGSLCQHNIDDCPAQNPCLNGGTCKDGLNLYTCDCPTGYEGNICQNMISQCLTSPCVSPGYLRCISLVNDFRCECLPGYTGKNCSINIDECASNPCLHGGNCTDGVYSYLCTCPDGWTGRRCEKIVDKCLGNPCSGSSNCSNLFNDFYCDCPANTYGKRCESSPNVCQDVNPCLNGGTCSGRSQATCNCNSNYKGDGCETLIDHCSEADKCKNGGTCKTLTNGIGFQCLCKPGYGGVNCQINNNDCVNSNCPASSTCIDMINAHYCRCNLGLAGEDCSRTLDSNYDLNFYLPTRNGYAALPYPIKLMGTRFTISLWVKFYETGNVNTYLTLFTVDDGNSLVNPVKLLEFDSNGVNVYEQSGVKTISQKYETINDGNWYNVVFQWSNETGGNYIINSLSQGSNRTMLNGYSFNHNVWIVLGGKLSTTTILPVINEGFRGYLSQLNIYSTALDFASQIPDIYSSPRTIFPGTILRWNEFVLNKGVQPVYPSQASKDECVSGTNCVKNDKLPPTTTCPGDVSVLSNDRFTSVTWTEPVFQGAKIVKRRYRSGETFEWGRYQMTYEAIDEASNAVFCNFKIYVKSDNCTQPPNPFNGSQVCDTTNDPYHGCRIACSSNSEKISRPHPNIYTCGPSGSWNPTPSKRFIPLHYPPCGPVQVAKKRLVIQLAFPRVFTQYCIGVKSALEVEIRNAIKSIHSTWASKLCSATDCSEVTIKVTCGSTSGRRKRATISSTNAEIVIPQSEKDLTSGTDTLPAADVINRNVLESPLFDFSGTIPGATLDPNGFVVTTTDSCNVGETAINGFCVKCGPGTYWDSTTKTCINCPIGKYTALDGQSQCTDCPTGSTTQTVGTPSADMCKTSCTAGQFYSTSNNQCESCVVGYYQPLVGQFFCNWCGAGQTTSTTGSQAASSCYDECPSGKELSQNGLCVDCAIGTYRTSGVHASCTACPTGKSTVTTGSRVVGDCNIDACEAGHKRVGTGTCEKCPIGTYQPAKWQTNCISCGGARYTTDLEGSTALSDCKFFCEDGYQKESLTCVPCKIGFYKDSLNKYGQCKACPANKKTPTTGSTSSNDCSIFSCPAGSKSNSAGTQCEQCPKGEYQPNADQNSCLSCASGTSTQQTGSTNANQCLRYCDPGQERDVNGNCKNCQVGYYKNNDNDLFMSCTACQSNFVTPTTKSTQSSQCTVRACLVGTKRNPTDTGCDDCPLGTYQDKNYTTICINCPTKTSTRQIKSTSLGQCEEYCDPGYKRDTANNVCVPCERGYYKNNSPNLFMECTSCPIDKITPLTKATSINDCTQGNCTAGEKINGNSCLKCPIGFYQPNKWQTDCISCPPQKTTTAEGATRESDCILSCDPGYEDINGQCTKCQIGYYKVEQKAASCTKCPNGFITADIGSTSALECNVRDCDAGYKSVNNLCERCGYDQFQPLKNRPTCNACPYEHTTFLLTTASSATDCRVNCTSGTYLNPNYIRGSTPPCLDCERGYYRDNNNRKHQTCQICPSDFITPANLRASSQADCTIRNCTTPGQFRNSVLNSCRPCPLGTFSSIKWQDSCTDCPVGYTTDTTGNDDLSDCKLDCPSGQEETLGACKPCIKGFYRDKTLSFTCQPCTSGYTTLGTGSTTSAACNVSPCNIGEQYNISTSSCVKCPLNTYQDLANQFACKGCPKNGHTNEHGSTTIFACKSYCTISPLKNCSVCADRNDKTGAECVVCLNNYVKRNGECIHTCDNGYCVRGTCVRGTNVYCNCPENYVGNRCETRGASGLSNTEKIVAGTVSAGVGLLILIVLIVCCCTLAGKKSSSRKTIYREPQYQDDKASLFNTMPIIYDLFWTTPRMVAYREPLPVSVLGMPQLPEITFDNAAYDDPVIY